MKITKSIMSIALAICVCACEKEISDGGEPIDVQIAQNESNEILSFESVEEMEAQISALQQMSSDELSAWYAERDFESQYDALYRAAAEIEQAQSLDEALEIKAKFTPYFLYNDNPADEEMFNPYLPNENRDYAYVCNICGEVMIAGQIVNFNTITDIRDTREYQIAHDIITRESDPNITTTNTLKRTVGKRKFWAEGRYTAENRYVQIEFTAHKKGTFGWNKYATSYHIRISDSYRDSSRYGWVKYGHFVSGYFDGVDQNLYTAAEGCWTPEYKSHTFVDVGQVKSGTVGAIQLYIYSRGTDVQGEGPLNISYYAN